MAPPIKPPAIAAPTPRWAWAGADTAETASVVTAASATKVFLMAFTFLIERDRE
jgi:hypothetical protein